MKRLFSIVAAFAAILAFSSCQDAIQPETPDTPVSGQGFKVFTATTEMAATKTSLDGNDTDGYVVNWETGDQITIVDNAGNVGIYTTNESGTKADFTFTSGTEVSEAPFKAYYPATLYNNGTPTLPASQDYSPANIHQAPMYAESSNASLQFKNLGSIVRLNVSTTMSGKKVRKIILTATQGMSGAITNAATLASENFIATVSGTTGVTLDCSQSGVAIGNDAVPFHFSVPANTYTGLKITVITTDGIFQTRTLKSDKSIIAERSSIADVTVSFNNMSATDLSAKGTANTYMVSAAGNYKFNATVKGNGGIDPLTGTKATALSGISGVKVLWELGDTYGKTIKYYGGAYDINYADGYVYFSTPDIFQNGDAYVAVLDDSDNILWSWLIWATDAPSITTYNDLGIMDRNLGATATGNVACRGMMYAWGRKDPFPSPNNGSYTPNTFVPARMTAFTISNFDAEGMTVAYSIAHPTTYLQGWIYRYWQTESEFSLNMWWSDGKTIYDPCPLGWKVPSMDEMQIVVNSGVNLPGNGFIGNVSTDFDYGNPDSQYYWTSTGYDRNRAWGYHGGFTRDHVDDATRSGWSIRPVEDLAAADLSDYTDLSASGTANSYIIPAAGLYRFKATVKGNGAANLAGINKDTDAADIAKAELLWATYGNYTSTPSATTFVRRVFYKDGYVCFNTNDTYTEGNAAIAIKDASGNILWSWHLWFESDNLESLKQTYPGGSIFMDRNLGATANLYDANNTHDFGLIYQWGRKDPFLTKGEFRDDSINQGVAASVYGQGNVFLNSQMSSVAQSILSPTTYAMLSSTWVDDNQIDKDVLWAENKTIFDPCPVGWKVPSKKDWDDTFVSALLALERDYNSIGYSVPISSDQNTWIPSAGFRHGASMSHISSGSSQTQTDYFKAYKLHTGRVFQWAVDGALWRMFYYEGGHIEKSGVFDLDYSMDYGSFPQERIQGFRVIRTSLNSVRCVKE